MNFGIAFAFSYSEIEKGLIIIFPHRPNLPAFIPRFGFGLKFNIIKNRLN